MVSMKSTHSQIASFLPEGGGYAPLFYGKVVERAVRAVAADAVDLGKPVEQDAAAAFKDLAQFFAQLA